MPLTLRLDPWTPTYESALQIEDDETGPQPVVCIKNTIYAHP